MAFNQLGNDLSSLPWTGQSWIDSAKMAAMYNILQTASMNEQQMNTINAMNSLEQSIKLFSPAKPPPSPPRHCHGAVGGECPNDPPQSVGDGRTMLQQQQDPLSTLLQTTSAMDIQPQSSQLPSSLQTASGMPTAHVQPPPAGQSGNNRTHGHLQPSTSAAPPAFPPINPTADPKMAPVRGVRPERPARHHLRQKGTTTQERPPTSSATSTARAAESSCSIFPTTSSSCSQQPPLPTSSLPNPSTNTSRSMNLPQPDPELERFVSNLNHADLDFEFGANRGGFDTLKFFNEMGGAEVHESPEGRGRRAGGVGARSIHAARLSRAHQKGASIGPRLEFGRRKRVPADSPSTSLKLGGTNQEAAFPNGISLLSPASSSTHHSNPSSSKSMPLVFVSSAPMEKSAERRSSLLQKANKIPIYKQKFVNLTAQAPEPKGEDCYSFSTADCARSSRDSWAIRPANAGPAWSEDFVARLEADEHSWIRVNPFQTTEIDVRETPEWCRWESERRKPSLRVIVKEELPASTSAKETEDPPRPRLVLKFIKPVEPSPAAQSPADELEDPFGANGHKLKRKKHHKKRDRDKEWEYPGESKRAKKEKKHHRHHHGHRKHSDDHYKPVLNGSSCGRVSNGTTWKEVLEQPDSKQCRAIRVFNERCLAAKRNVHLERELRRDVTMLLDYYTTLIEIPTRKRTPTGRSVSPFHSCDPCSQQLRSYHLAEHGFFLLHKACDDYILDLALERPTASGKLLLGLAMRTFEPLRSMSDKILQLWLDYASVQTEDG
ncbi:hypothetical protein M3Y99_00870000 [Aphelenchoides fujianensis]|nr:hypothetical protein M3Y99_00870000 [Aphelenchoides fujianensis]